MEPGRVLAAFDAEVRRNVRPDGSGALIEAGRHVVRWVGADGRGWSGIAWSGLGDADADAVIAEQVDYFAARRDLASAVRCRLGVRIWHLNCEDSADPGTSRVYLEAASSQVSTLRHNRDRSESSWPDRHESLHTAP
jgi:hypothetical protein